MFTSYASAAMTWAIKMMKPVFEYIVPILKRLATNFALNTAVAYVANTFYPNEADGWENVGIPEPFEPVQPVIPVGIPVADVD